MTPKDQPPDLKMSDMLLGKIEGELPKAPRMNEMVGQSEYETQLLMSL